VAATWWFQRNAKVRWAREQALPEIIRLAGDDQFDAAFRLAMEAEPYLEAEPVFQEQVRAIVRTATIASVPPGATISYRPYGRPNEAWREIGRTPVESAAIPRGMHQWKAELAGFEVAEDVGPGPFWPPRFTFRLVPAGQAPPGMVRVASSDQPFQIFIPGLDHLPEVALADYWIDRHEVTNREFKRFVDDGGYTRSEFWREPFVKDGKPIAAAVAMAMFVDATGRPGPAPWEQGTYPAGLADHPAGGVSWYEAAAYARWAGKSLPTIYHWSRAADQRLSADVVPASNFGGKEVLPVDRAGGANRAGASGMAGNVKEWVWNAAGARRYILGGGWNEPVYMFTDVDAQSPLSRLPAYGFRCVKIDRPEDLAQNLVADVTVPSRDLRRIVPPSEAVFREWKSIYSFDHGSLNARVDATDDTSPEWRMEKVSYAAAYGDERITAYLFLPKNAAPPYQTVVYFPGSGVISRRTNPAVNDFERVNYIMRSGRALIYPIYKSTHERGDVITNDYPSQSAVWRDHMVMWSKDVGRTIDYLESRPDIDRQKIGYMGFSWGAGMAPLFLAVEPRLSLGMLLVGGFYLQAALPVADPVNFAARVKIPVVMLNGRFDFFFPTELSQKPMFDSLGTPPEHKRRVEYDASHALPRNEVIKEFVGWMDKYWGPVRPPQ
jgi:formylglycine-generating enzyme required for sulfatase activity/dienelactone hydrolase